MTAISILARDDFQKLLDVLLDESYQVIAPVLADNAVVYDQVTRVDEMPAGWTDTQEGGKYQLHKSDNDTPTLFGYTASPQSWKRFLHPPQVKLWQALRSNGTFEMTPEVIESQKYAFIGVRACELHAIAIQDRVFLESGFVDPHYRANRENLFIVAVNCGHAGRTCFCTSMGTGPKAESGFDLALTEVIEAEQHYFVVETGSEKGDAVLQKLPHRAATESEIAAAEYIIRETAQNMGRHVDTAGIKELLYRNYEHARWEIVAERCLSCGNCTMVCPTCFCTTVEDVTDLSGTQAQRNRFWDSCFTMDFSYIHGGSVRNSTKSRYRQWITHKLATWQDQFDCSGCVGCGRCITWCPVGIDITQEVAAIRASDRAPVKEEIHEI